MLLKLMKDNIENTEVLCQNKHEPIFYAKIGKTTKIAIAIAIAKCKNHTHI